MWGAGPLVVPLSHPAGCDQDHWALNLGSSIPAQDNPQAGLAWLWVPMWGHLELPEGQKGLEQCLFLPIREAGSQFHFLLAWLIHGSSSGVPAVMSAVRG